MPSFRVKRQRSAWLWFAVVIGGCSLVIAFLLPAIGQAKTRYIDRQLEQARTAADKGDYGTAESILQRTAWLRFGDPRPLLALGEDYEQTGRYPEAIAAYHQLRFRQGFSREGAAALASQDYGTAQRVYKRAVREQPTADNYAYLAKADFNLSQTDAGCQAADQAIKASLASDTAQQAQLLCLLLRNQDAQAQQAYPALAAGLSGNPRLTAYTLIRYGAVKAGEDRLSAVAEKTPGDWLLLARIAAARADIHAAISRAESGIKLDPTSISLNQALLRYYGLNGQSSRQANIRESLKYLGVN